MRANRKVNRLGNNQKKVLLLLLGGLALSFSRSPGQYFKIGREISKEWNQINKQALERAIANLYKSKLIMERAHPDGSTTMILTESGKKKAITFNLDTLEIKKPKKWDQKLRMVVFDIPEKQKKVRNALRDKLKQMGFYEFQKSVFIHPYECKDEIDYVIEMFELRPHVRTATVVFVDNELHLKKIFNLA